MLVINRRQGERIVIGIGADAVEIVVLETHRSTVRLGIEAPAGTSVVRAEVVDAGRAETTSREALVIDCQAGCAFGGCPGPFSPCAKGQV